MSSNHRWVLRDGDGREFGSTETFPSQAAAEEWLGRQWVTLLEEGAESVVLMDAGTVVYEMGLQPADPG
jgi:hypothetical protein